MSDMHYTVVALGSMDMSISLVLKLHHSIWKHITDNISILFEYHVYESVYSNIILNIW